MWVILVNKDLSESRDNIISSLLDNNLNDIKESFLYQSRNKYYVTTSISSAKFWKTKSGAQKVISYYNTIRPTSNYSFNNKFPYMSGNVMRVRQLTKEEYNSIIDFELSKLDSAYNRRRSKIESKKIK